MAHACREKSFRLNHKDRPESADVPRDIMYCCHDSLIISSTDADRTALRPRARSKTTATPIRAIEPIAQEEGQTRQRMLNKIGNAEIAAESRGRRRERKKLVFEGVHNGNG